MPRKPRIEEPGGFYHVVSRGNNKQDVFDNALRPVATMHLGLVARRFGWRVFAWAWMSNHFHLVLQIADSGLSKGMQQLNLSLARASNVRFGRVNHCFGQRFWSAQLEKDEHLLSSIRYTLWNPARAGVGEHPGDSGWTSFRASAGREMPPDVLALANLLTHFGTKPATAQEAFERFVLQGRERCLEPWQDGRGILT
jgi:REP element-mobilizing transposase RayT